VSMTLESNRSHKSKAITQSPAHRLKGTGTAKEKGFPTPMPGEDCTCKSKEIAFPSARWSMGTGTATEHGNLTKARDNQTSRREELGPTPTRRSEGPGLAMTARKLTTTTGKD
jgi:hypothetical protein